ncbi:hypothetical protein L227DRAFT_342372 [Lentinus tigrinus ALCF2SS1-6]|uniref:Uncharacterized protein n=1 Tax=Lentinus tigrinus ALCF2SS1-6 TaxID=1328759 RepID=A0A5C2RT17_9APHY|nr:hypothetical protein L227DRAFT_342372 [Lentinus tigrinus ALCF2SS1-6]
MHPSRSQTNPTPPAGGSARIALVPSTAPPQSRLIIPQPISPLRPGQQPPSVPELRCISFDTNGRGVPLAELLSSPAEALQQKIPDFRDTTILEILLTHIQIKVYWPGYEHLNFTHEVYLSESGAGGVSCKGELAIEAAKAYDAFFKQAAQCNSIRGHLSFAITPAPDGPFSLGNLALVSINNVHDGVFRACVEIIRGPALECVLGRVQVSSHIPGFPTHIAQTLVLVPRSRTGVRWAQMPVPTALTPPAPAAVPLPVATRDNCSGLAHPSRAQPQPERVSSVADGGMGCLGPAQR